MRQDDVTVAGRALDAATGSPVQFATVTVLRDGMPVGGELADEEGRFVIEGLERGSYTVSVGFVGYTAAEAPLLIGERNDHYDLGDLALARAADVTDEVIVTAQRQILEANLDRRVFNLGEDIARATGSVLDAMRGLPGVTVSQEGRSSCAAAIASRFSSTASSPASPASATRAGSTASRPAASRASRSSTTRPRRTTRPAWPASSTSSIGRIKPKACSSMRVSRSASARSTSASPICRPSSAVSRRTRRSTRA